MNFTSNSVLRSDLKFESQSNVYMYVYLLSSVFTMKVMMKGRREATHINSKLVMLASQGWNSTLFYIDSKIYMYMYFKENENTC